MFPTEHLINISKQYRDAWTQVEVFRQSRGVDLPDWPAWCFLPMAAWYAIVRAQHKANQLPFNLIGDVAKLAAIGTWRSV